MTELENILERIRGLVREKRQAEAVELLKESLEMAREEAERIPLLMELGIVYNGVADFSQALNCFNEVLRLKPDQAQARTYVAMINDILDFYHKDLLNP